MDLNLTLNYKTSNLILKKKPPSNCRYFDTGWLRRETDVNTEPLFIRGDRLTVAAHTQHPSK